MSSGSAGLTVVPRPSPNHGPRAPGTPTDILLLHYTGMRTTDAALGWLCDPASQVSCHYLVDEGGTVFQLVDEERRAWHAGVSFWAGETDVNSRSIGIEVANPGHEFGYTEYPAPQIAGLTALCRDILARRRIAARRVIAHSDVAPERKRDPGEKFPWERLAAAGVGHWVDPAPIRAGPVLAVGTYGAAVRRLQTLLATYGYRAEVSGVFDWQTEIVVTAFQRHFRQERVDGRADASTLETLAALAAAGQQVQFF